MQAESALHGLERYSDDFGRGIKIRVADLQTDELVSAGLEGIDTVGEGNGEHLANEFELVVEVHGEAKGKVSALPTQNQKLHKALKPVNFHTVTKPQYLLWTNNTLAIFRPQTT